MAKKYKQPSIVSGKSVKDILNIDIEDFNKLNLSDLRKVVGRLVSAGNKRLRTFEKAEESSPAVRYIMRSGGMFSTKGKNINQLRSEFVRAKDFLESKTGTKRGWEKVKKETIQGLEDNGVEITKEEFDKFWKSYNKLKELSPDVANKELRYRILQEIAEVLNASTKSAEEIAESINNRITDIYEERAERYGESGVSEFFDIE